MSEEKIYDLKRRTFVYSLEVIGLLRELEKSYIAETIGKQLLRSATSVGTNIMEAQSAPSRKDFANFFNIALKSANESLYWLALIKSTKIGDAEKVEKLTSETQEICKIVAKSLLIMRGK